MKKKNKKNFIYNIEKPEYYHNSSFNLNILKSLIENAGYGVFTQDKIPNNTFIDRYEGDIKYFVKTGEYYFAINDNIGIDAFLYPRCYMAMINDAKGSIFSNNCDFKIDEKELIIEVWSIRDIKDGEELLINYGSEYWIW
jgi:SET domain-containing protein